MSLCFPRKYINTAPSTLTVTLWPFQLYRVTASSVVQVPHRFGARLAMDSDGENDELLERLPWGVWRCCDEAAPIYGKEHDRTPNTTASGPHTQPAQGLLRARLGVQRVATQALRPSGLPLGPRALAKLGEEERLRRCAWCGHAPNVANLTACCGHPGTIRSPSSSRPCSTHGQSAVWAQCPSLTPVPPQGTRLHMAALGGSV